MATRLDLTVGWYSEDVLRRLVDFDRKCEISSSREASLEYPSRLCV
jgi:archaellum component FlaD/FlaE